MTRVDFYILPDPDREAMHRFACRLATKALGAGQKVHLHGDDAEHAAELDKLLWQYPNGRFLPHQVLGLGVLGLGKGKGVAPIQEPITIGCDEPNDLDQVLINLAQDIPRFFGRFDRVAEIIVQEQRDLGRERYKWYRDRGYPLFHHELNDWEN